MRGSRRSAAVVVALVVAWSLMAPIAGADPRFPNADALGAFALAPQEAAQATGASGGLQILNHEGGNTCRDENGGFTCRRSWGQMVVTQVYPYSLGLSVFSTREQAVSAASSHRGYRPRQDGATGIVLENDAEMAVSYSHSWGSDSVWAIAQSGPYVVEASCTVRRGHGTVDQLTACARTTIDAQFVKIAGTRRVTEPPGPPTNVTANLDGRAVLLTWAAPLRDGGSPVTSYTVTADEDGLTCTVPASGPEGSCLITGIRPGIDYMFRVVASNAVGPGEPSGAVVPARLVTRPDAPRAVTTKRRASDVTVRWKAPTGTGGSPLRSYVVTASPGERTCTTRTTTCLMEDLGGGIAYRFSVRALTDQGMSTPARSKPVRIPAPPPPPPAPVPTVPIVDPKPEQSLS
jgi:Fibronectin type III domain